uniref:X8 domain-containing protein n=1 Tax=Strombidinopsis acuminata TaxID=141414 RepID=A0A7S3W923_9SPIT|mmetsp:Transcript_20290/g.28030  ORF Transcript_20290/g.28030 Transcript_20290/m.28030 type:complete len:382 (+) Transcript_20290:1-1146(+)
MTFPTTPVYIGEYHRVRANQTEDLSMILSLAEQSSLFFGISFFEYQVAYWKTGSEMDFGMFGLGDYIIEEMPYFGKSFNIHCLTTQVNSLTGKTISNELRSVYKGPGLDESVLCKPNPLAAPTSGYGYAQVMNQKDPHQMAVFAENVVQHLGGVVTNYEKLNGTAQATVGNPPKWADLVSDLAYGPDWVEIDPAAKCVADRNAMPSVVGEQISWVCSNANSFSCDELPKHCADNTYRTADYVFSRYYEELGNQASPLTSCNFTNSGIYASSRIYRRWTGAEFCIKDAATGPMPQPIPVPSPSPLPSPTPGPSPPADLPMPSPSPGDGDGHHDITLTETTTTAGAAASTTSEMEMASFTTSSAKVNSWLALALLAGCGLLWA